MGGNNRGEADFNDTVLTTGEGGSQGDLKIKDTARIMRSGIVKNDGLVLSNVVSIAAGNGFSVGLQRNGTVTGWGAAAPIHLSNVVAIAAASLASLAVKSDGTVMRWEGYNYSSEYGQWNAVPGLSNVVAVATSEAAHGTRDVALKKDGTVKNWGRETVYKDATPPAGLSNVVAIAVGYNHTLALKRDGTVVGWGFNTFGGATGVSTTNSPSNSAGVVTVNGQTLSNIVSIAAGRGCSMALRSDGTVVTWGRMVQDLYPVAVPAGLSNVVAIAAGNNFCLAITTNAAVAEYFRKDESLK